MNTVRKIVLDVFVFYKDFILAVDRKDPDPHIINCLTSVWDYLPVGEHPLERVKKITQEIGFEYTDVFLNAVGSVYFDQDAIQYLPMVFRVEVKNMVKPKSNEHNLCMEWMKWEDFLKDERLYDEYKKLDLRKIFDKKQYFFKAQNDYEGNINNSIEILL